MKRQGTVQQLQAELDAMATSLAQTFPTTNAGITFRVTSFRASRPAMHGGLLLTARFCL